MAHSASEQRRLDIQKNTDSKPADKPATKKSEGSQFEFHVPRGRMAEYNGGDLNRFEMTDGLKAVIKTEAPDLGAAIDAGVEIEFHISAGQEDNSANEQIVTIRTKVPMVVTTVDGELKFEQAE